jgi:hypothetical protein
MAKLVTGLFNTRSSAMLAVEDLMRHGFAQEDLSLLSTDTNLGRELYTDMHSKAPEGAVIGSILGMLIGGIVAGLMQQGYITDFGWGMLMMHRVPAILDGVAVGSILGLILGALIGVTVPEYEVSLYRADKRHGGILLAVYTHGRRQSEVSRLVEAAGGRKLTVKNVADEALPERQRILSGMSDRETMR